MSTNAAAPGEPAGRPGGGWQSRPFLPDVLAGGVFVVLGLAFAIAGSQYDVGSALNMGSGYVPIALGSLLTILGVVIVVASFRGGDPTVLATERAPVPWRRAALLVGAILFFGFFVRGLGLGPSLLVTTFIAALAGHRTGPVKAALIATGLTAMCLVVFVALLQLRLPILGDWLGG
jgi:hypothetical protein